MLPGKLLLRIMFLSQTSSTTREDESALCDVPKHMSHKVHVFLCVLNDVQVIYCYTKLLRSLNGLSKQ